MAWSRVPRVGSDELSEVLYDKGEGIAKVPMQTFLSNCTYLHERMQWPVLALVLQHANMFV